MRSRARNSDNSPVRTRFATCLAALAVGCFLSAAPLPAADAPADGPAVVTPPPAARDVFAQFASMLEELQKHYIDPAKVQAGEHTTTILREYIRSLNPEADYYTPEEVTAAAAVPPEIGDLGLSLAILADYPTVISARDDSPAQSAHLFTGDQLVAINGQSTVHARLFDVLTQLRDPVASKFILRVTDPVIGVTRTVTLARGTPSSEANTHLKFLGKGVAYCRLAEFSLPVVEQLQTDIKRAENGHARGLILDLRNNAGGAFDAAVVAARLFLPNKAEIVSLDYSKPEFRTTFVSDNGNRCTIPVVLLVNGGTAAEAEIFTAALRDNGRARLVGSKTFGRALFFGQFPLPDGSAVYIPTAQYLPPSHQSFQSAGLVPDIEVEIPRDAERRLATVGFGGFDWVNDKADVLKTDITLARALQLFGQKKME